MPSSANRPAQEKDAQAECWDNCKDAWAGCCIGTLCDTDKNVEKKCHTAYEACLDVCFDVVDIEGAFVIEA